MAAFLFVLSTGHCGTTLLSQILAHSFNGFLPPWGNNEGQFCPELAAVMREKPWDPSHPFPWSKIHSIWSSHLQASGKKLFIEASPPNLIRFEALHQVFGKEARYLILTGNPYAYVASCLYYYHSPGYNRLPDADQLELVNTICSRWIERTAILHQLHSHPAIGTTLSYQQLCKKPAAAVACVALACHLTPQSDLASLQLRGKAQQTASISDLSWRNISFLQEAELDQISACLSQAPELLHFTNTRSIRWADVAEQTRLQPELIEAGRRRRVQGPPHQP
jgi:hypothetical protein